VAKIWVERLEAATSEGEVVEVAREYIATLSAGDIERLPKPCRPPRFLSAADVTGFSDTLVRHDCIVDGATARLVGRMCDFFSAATLRLAALKAVTPGPA
jgi:hypothetical protein